jgi:diacylglycerol kinase family enzyme
MLPDAEVIVTECVSELPVIIKERLERDETTFIAAGGDGTLNTLLNTLIQGVKDKERIKGCCIGAIGLGSSNDFHKPFLKEKFIQNIPCKINTKEFTEADVCRLEFHDKEGIKLTKYFVINASIGATAYANYLYNNPDFLLKHLKNKYVGLAILYAALCAIVSHKNQKGIILDSGENIQTDITNLGILKIPYFSGDFFYDMPMNPQDGYLTVNLCYTMNKVEMIRTLVALSKGVFKGEKTRSWKTKTLTVKMDNYIPVETDGEINFAREMLFSVLPRAVKICS